MKICLTLIVTQQHHVQNSTLAHRCVRLVTMTFAPALTNPFAIIRPIPLELPVTKTFLPATLKRAEGDDMVGIQAFLCFSWRQALKADFPLLRFGGVVVKHVSAFFGSSMRHTVYFHACQ